MNSLPPHSGLGLEPGQKEKSTIANDPRKPCLSRLAAGPSYRRGTPCSLSWDSRQSLSSLCQAQEGLCWCICARVYLQWQGLLEPTLVDVDAPVYNMVL
jgi:hypothetical protein|mmetsp:Transcript_66566/g.111317  ORF Transcript_66566/g.111317 Transcript_66566/m.111317 type:complete len:99 (+) Transcript_66566:800-1096(+)